MKHHAFTLTETKEELSNIFLTPAPQVVAFHSLTNDLKSMSESECVSGLHDVVEQTYIGQCGLIVKLLSHSQPQDSMSTKLKVM